MPPCNVTILNISILPWLYKLAGKLGSYFYLVFVAGCLVYAGLTDNCLMGMLLMKLTFLTFNFLKAPAGAKVIRACCPNIFTNSKLFVLPPQSLALKLPSLFYGAAAYDG